MKKLFYTLAMLLCLFFIASCDGAISNNINNPEDPLEEAPPISNPEEKENAKMAVEELKKFYTAFHDDVESDNERAEIYNSFKDPKLSGKTLKTEDGSFSCTMITEKDVIIIYNEVELDNQTYWAKVHVMDNAVDIDYDFITKNEEDVIKISGKTKTDHSTGTIKITSIHLNNGLELINDSSLTEEDKVIPN